jgi:hypothetical protein
MKNRIISLLAGCLAAAAMLGSCSVDVPPSNKWPAEVIWGSQDNLDNYVKRFYVTFRNAAEINQSDRPVLTDAYSDILKNNDWDNMGYSFNTANLLATAFNSTGAGAFECWADQYNRIREVNEFLNDAPTMGAAFDTDWMNVRMAEARFSRAYSYYLLCRVYGGVVLRTGLDGPEQNDKARATEQESWDWIVSELEEIAPMLPVSWPDTDFGRVTRKGAYALLSRVALHARDWSAAVTAADNASTAGAALTGDYESVFIGDIKNPEICFAVAFLTGQIGHRYDLFMRPPGDAAAVGSTATVHAAYSPTSELADEFEMADGTAFSWASHGTNPYADRDPRFYKTILYNGAHWMGRTLDTSNEASPDGFRPWANTTGAKRYTVSGYYFRKYLTDNDTSWTTVNSDQYWILVRYAEVLLNKAEALAEQGNIQGALAALNEVRGRESVELPARTAANKEEFMAHLRHERIVELAGEGLRYWDLRRWRLAEEVLNGKSMHGVKITGTAPDWNYEQVDVDGGFKHVFYPYYYNFAIPQSERANNKLCTNNDGW